MSNLVTKVQFENLLKVKLGEHYERALAVFTHYGPILSRNVADVLSIAADKGKIDDVLTELEKHWQECLFFQPPEMRGTTNKTRTMFLGVYANILQLGT